MAAPGAADIQALDRDDPLAAIRELFHLPHGLVYLDGNSLGPAPNAVVAEMARAVRDEWAEGLIGSWNEAGWSRLPDTLGAAIAPLVGAEADEVVVCDNVSVNLHKALNAALALNPGRRTLVASAAGFPTDLYVAQGLREARPDIALRLEGRDGARLEDLVDEETAVVLLDHVDYRSSALRDMAALTALAHDRGALVVWDLCHSVGVMPIELDACGADLAVGCTYKFLNGGPGAPAFVHAARRHHGAFKQPLTGWWSHADPFAFAPDYRRAAGMHAMLTGTQPILSMRALKAALELWRGVDLAAVREKGMRLTDLFIALVEERCAGHGLQLASPRDATRRGSHVSFRHPDGYAIVQALIARGVVGDFRAPDLLRFGFAPLYLRFADVAKAADTMRDVLESKAWRDPAFARRAAVT